MKCHLHTSVSFYWERSWEDVQREARPARFPNVRLQAGCSFVEWNGNRESSGWKQGAMWNLASHWTPQTFPVLNNFLQTHDSQDTVLIHSYALRPPSRHGCSRSLGHQTCWGSGLGTDDAVVINKRGILTPSSLVSYSKGTQQASR